MEAVQLRVAEQYVEQFGHLAKQANSVIVPATVSNLAGMVALKVFDSVPPAAPPRASSPPAR